MFSHSPPFSFETLPHQPAPSARVADVCMWVGELFLWCWDQNLGPHACAIRLLTSACSHPLSHLGVHTCNPSSEERQEDACMFRAAPHYCASSLPVVVFTETISQNRKGLRV